MFCGCPIVLQMLVTYKVFRVIKHMAKSVRFVDLKFRSASVKSMGYCDDYISIAYLK